MGPVARRIVLLEKSDPGIEKRLTVLEAPTRSFDDGVNRSQTGDTSYRIDCSRMAWAGGGGIGGGLFPETDPDVSGVTWAFKGPRVPLYDDDAMAALERFQFATRRGLVD